MLRLLPVSHNLFLPAFNSSKSILTALVFVLSALAFNTLDAQSALASRSVSNTTHCNNGQVYGAWLNFEDIDNYYSLSDALFVEYSDGTALYTGTITNNTYTDIIFHINVKLSGRTFNTPQDSPKANECGNNNTSDWYYYTSTSGILTGAGVVEGAILSISRKGPSFQLGTGANQTEGAAVFNASGWFNIHIIAQPYISSLMLNGNSGDFNINLSGAALIDCNNLTDGGKIGPYEVSGGPFNASTIISEKDPSGGGAGAIEYMWLSTTDPTLPWEQWIAIDGANTSTYEPGEITVTTYFLRCSRRYGCSYWSGESNIIAKIINGDGVTCNTGAQVEEKSGDVAEAVINSGVNDKYDIIGAIDEHAAQFYDKNDYLIIELDETLSAGEQLTVSWKGRNYNSTYNGNSRLNIMESLDGDVFETTANLETNLKKFYVHQTITLKHDTRFLKLTNRATTGDTSPDFDVDAISYNKRTCIELGSIGDRVWEDINGNGAQDDGEPGIQGVFVFLEDANGNAIPGIDFKLTDANGTYLFDNLPLGTYKVRFATPEGFLPTKPNKVSDDENDSDASFLDGRTDVIDLNAKNNDLSVDAGYIRPLEFIGIVWFDLNKNGTQDANEGGVENVAVTLFDAGDDMIAGTSDDQKFADAVTDENGFYTVFNVLAGKYYVVFDSNTLPLGYSFTQRNIGTDKFNDSDADPTTGITDVFSVPSTINSFSGVDAGLILTCGFIPSAKIGDATCEGFPVEFQGAPDSVGFTYTWEFLDDETNPVVIGNTTGKFTTFTWLTPGVKVYHLTVSNAEGCAVTLTGKFTVLPAEDEVCTSLLPVELIDFEAEVINKNEVLISWSTAWEQDNNFFEVQRSTDGEQFQTIGMVTGSGTTESENSYDFIDETPFYGKNYYRLKQVDFNGTFDITDVRSVVLGNDDLSDVIAYPNPTKANTTLRVVTPFEQDAQIEVVNAAGQILETLTLEAGNNSKEIDLSRYQPGFYFLNIKYNGFKKLVHRVLKVRD